MIAYNKLLSNGDRPVIFVPSNYRRDTGKPGVVVLPGTGAPWEAAYDRGVLLNIAEALTTMGYPVITTDCGVDEFGNQRARDGIAAAIDWAQSQQIGVRSGKVHGWGFSQGGGSILSFAGNNPGRMLTVGGVCPLTDINVLVQQGGTAKQFADNAFPPAYSEATHGAGSNPQTMAAAGKFASLPMTICVSSNDPVLPPQSMRDFKNTVGSNCKLVELGAVGHDHSVFNLPAAVTALVAQIGS